MTAASVLIVDADAEGAAALGRHVSDIGALTRHATSLSAALAALDEDDRPVDLVAIDPDTAAAGESLGALLRSFEPVPVVVTATGGGRRAVEALRAGAADFLDKPYDREAVRFVLQKSLAARSDPAVPMGAPSTASQLLGQSKSMHHVLDVLRRVAKGTATVLVRGESGTGKELAARALHAESARAAGPFVKVHCAALPDTLLESELFGYERGAFTGATARKPGRVEVAEGGTLFLDEIGDITPAMQVKLLRLVQDREYERLGSTVTQRADVRLVSATHRDLEHMIKKGEFREDLFYRLNVVPLWLPPLRARRDDIEVLAVHFCSTFATAHGRRGTTLSQGALAVLRAERWPGNVRELQNFVERLVVLSESKIIEAADVQRELSPPVSFATQTGAIPARALEKQEKSVEDAREPSPDIVPLDVAVRDAERSAIERALTRAEGNRTLAARLLGVSRAGLYTKLEEHGLLRRDPET